MKITGMFACFLLLAAASVRADSFSFRDNYFRNSTIDLPASPLSRGTHIADWNRDAWTFSAVNEGPLGFLSHIDPSPRPVKLATVAKAPRAPGTRKSPALPFIRPDEVIDYKLSVRKPRPGMDYKLRVVPGEPAETLR